MVDVGALGQSLPWSGVGDGTADRTPLASLRAACSTRRRSRSARHRSRW